MALGDIHWVGLHFAWQAWHLVTSTFTLCGRRGTLVITPLVITQLVITQLVITQLVITCPHTTCSHTQLVITPFARTQLVHTQLAHTQLVLTQLVLTCSHTTCPHMAGVGLGDSTLHFARQAWHLVTRGRRGTYGTGLALARLVIRWRRGAAAFCVAGVALCDIHLHFVWQAWRLTTSIVTLRGRRGTGTGLALVARLVTRWRRGAAAFCGRRGTS